MGLDTSHDCWHGAYSAFSRWRDKIAVAAGYSLTKADDGKGFTWDIVQQIDWSAITEANLAGEWERIPEDPLIVLIAHSDCDGRIHPREGKLLADRLEELLPKIEQLGDGGGHIGYYRDKTQKFIDGLRHASSKGEDVEFR